MDHYEIRWKIVELVFRMDDESNNKQKWDLVEKLYNYVYSGKK